jgi:hypothetical protein
LKVRLASAVIPSFYKAFKTGTAMNAAITFVPVESAVTRAFCQTDVFGDNVLYPLRSDALDLNWLAMGDRVRRVSIGPHV